MGFSARKIFANDQKITRLGYLQDDTGEMVLSGSGYTVAISSGPENNGVVKVYDWNGSSWVQKGQTISNSILEFATWFFGSNIKISSNGNRIAFTYNTAISGPNLLYAIVFEWNGSSWNRLGETIEASINAPLRVGPMSINSDASRIIIATYNSNANWNLVFSWNGSSWVQLGSNINLTAVSNTSMDLSGNRIVFSLGSPNVSFGGFCCFSWNGSSWVQLGQKIQGAGYNEYYISDASISPSGNMVAVSYSRDNNDRYVRFFSWNGSSWVKIRDDVDVTPSSFFDDQYSLIKINSTENIFSFIQSNEFYSQIAYDIFYWDGIKWTKIGSDYGEASIVGGGMDLSGTIVACPFRVYEPGVSGISEARVTRYLNK
jgi:hypothetical protein